MGAFVADDPPSLGSPNPIVVQYLPLAGGTDNDALAHAPNPQEEDTASKSNPPVVTNPETLG
ncbi:MAG TPA: hypothetical protein VNW25_07035 [Candidatus Sulfotelmatobacter sp.]|nr:hypothetical protein [Candidatus Sulfotelmatobacter sp.]